MKKLFSFLLLLPLVSFGQQGQVQGQAQATQVNVDNTTINPVDYNIGRAAKAKAMSEPKNDIITPLTVDLYDYTHIAIVGATCSGNTKPKACYNLISDGFMQSALTVINPVDYDKKKFKKNPSFLRTIKNPKWVYVTYQKSIQGVDDYRTLTIRDSQNKVLYKVNTRNIPATEVYSVLTDM